MKFRIYETMMIMMMMMMIATTTTMKFFFFFILSNKNRISKCLIDDINFVNFLTKKKNDVDAICFDFVDFRYFNSIIFVTNVV